MIKEHRNMTEEIIVQSGVKLVINKRETDKHIEVSLCLKDNQNCRLHWGLSRRMGGKWEIPSHAYWPSGSIAIDETAIQTPFDQYDNERRITISMDKSLGFRIVNFVLYYPETDTWVNNNGRNYYIKLPEQERLSTISPEEVIKEEIGNGKVLFKSEYDIESEGRLISVLFKDGENFRIVLVSDVQGPLLLHWGAAIQSFFEWRLPPKSIQPPGTKPCDEKAVQTPFTMRDNLNRLTISFNKDQAPVGITFVLNTKDEELWFSDHGKNFYIPVTELEGEEGYPGPTHLAQTAREIVKAEMGHSSWTLMHRFNLCYDLLEKAGKEEEGLALLFVWLRYSFLRQLDWQRNYNTQPRELSHSQDRLTLRLAGMYINQPENRDLIRLIMTTLGKGGDGQRIRDEILQIMHRHHVKEVAGTFLEEWHQKLHNNTTPDDIVICEAYLAFLRSNGNRDSFYETLEAGGVTKERLENFERPIVTHPEFIPHIKDALIHDFENFLKLLRSVHSGTDLESAADAAGYLLDYEIRGPLEYIFHHRNDSSVPLLKLAGNITELRRLLNKRLTREKEEGRARDMIYLDLAVEEYLRTVVERNIHLSTDRDELVELISIMIENARISMDNFDLKACYHHWNHLRSLNRFDKDWSMNASSVLERLGRSIADISDRYYTLFQSKAEYLGKAFHAEQWIINMFSEEIIRGRLPFILSLLVHHLDPGLRKDAELGNWQIISPGQATGTVEVIDSLSSIQNKVFDKPVIIIADKVKGNEEPPEGLRAVITPDMVDLVAHVAIRARNYGLLFATCYDRKTFEQLKSLKGQTLSLAVSPSGDVEVKEASGEEKAGLTQTKLKLNKIARPEISIDAISSDEFNEKVVGGKSNNLIYLQDKLPDWIHMPSSAAIPFGVFEKILELDMNKKIAENYNGLLKNVDSNPPEILSKIRKTLLGLEAPGELVSSIRIAMNESGLNWPENWTNVWMCIKKVWASKWNERAYVSRKTAGVSHEDLFMAVLIQQVVRADYAFVVHTMNPFTGEDSELYAEIVLGLGETLVGNYPGRALGFVFNKSTKEINIMSYPSKSFGLTGGGLIFRSDSNGEDLAGYAGAGLYESVLLDPPREVPLNYANERLIWDREFKNNILTSIADLGISVEEVVGSPQDIEGAYSDDKFYVVQTRPQV